MQVWGAAFVDHVRVSVDRQRVARWEEEEESAYESSTVSNSLK
jgi:hypothetical protein